MVNSKENYMHLTLNGKVVASFWISPTKDGGFSFGPTLERSDLHLTVWQKNGKFRYHVRHKGIKEPSDESPIGGQKSTKMVLYKMEKMLVKRLKHYHGNKTCWTFPLSRWKKLKSLLPSVDVKGNLNVPLEFIYAQLDMDFSKSNLWRKIKIRSLVTIEPYFGFIETEGRLRLIKPVSRNMLFAWPLSKVDEIQKYFFREIGIDDFTSYLKHSKESKEYWSKVKDRIEQMKEV